MVTLEDVVDVQHCRSCGQEVTHLAFVHVHDEEAGACDWLCLDCWNQTVLWALRWHHRHTPQKRS